MSNGTLLVTGGAGFIGSNFILNQITRGLNRIINLDALTYAGHLETLEAIMDHPDHDFVLGSIGDASLVAYLLERHQPDAIIHFAVESHVDRSIDAPEDFIQTNIVGTFQLLEATYRYWRNLSTAQKSKFRFVHISTDEVYGSTMGEQKVDESSPYHPSSPYAASKASSNHLVHCYHITYGLPTLTINSTNNYGPRQYPEKLIPRTIYSAIKDQPIELYGDGQQLRNWIFVEDHCMAIECIASQGTPGESYNVGGNSEKTNLEVVQRICDGLDRIHPKKTGRSYRELIQFVPDRPGHDLRYHVDMSKIHALGWSPRKDFDSGLESTIHWYLENTSWCATVLKDHYAGERLGLGFSRAKKTS